MHGFVRAHQHRQQLPAEQQHARTDDNQKELQPSEKYPEANVTGVLTCGYHLQPLGMEYKQCLHIVEPLQLPSRRRLVFLVFSVY